MVPPALPSVKTLTSGQAGAVGASPSEVCGALPVAAYREVLELQGLLEDDEEGKETQGHSEKPHDQVPHSEHLPSDRKRCKAWARTLGCELRVLPRRA
jgi:hypothetical protein